MLLSALGIPDLVFTNLFRNRISSLKGLAARARQHQLEGEPLAIAQHTTTVRLYSPVNHYGCSSGLQRPQFPVAKLLKLGFDKDPVLLDVLEAVERRLFSDLLWNARVEVKNGAYLLGTFNARSLVASFPEGHAFFPARCRR